MFAFLERRLARFRESRARRRSESAVRQTIERNLRRLHIRYCPGCQVPIEKNEGCDHMRCALCGLSFSWKLAVPCNPDVLDNNTGDGRWRICPHCRYQNKRMHSMDDARCEACLQDFKWADALFVPVTQVHTPPQGTRARSNATAGLSEEQSQLALATIEYAVAREAALGANSGNRPVPVLGTEGQPWMPGSMPSEEQRPASVHEPAQAETQDNRLIQPAMVRDPTRDDGGRRNHQRTRWSWMLLDRGSDQTRSRERTGRRRSENDCGTRRNPERPQVTAGLKHWLNDPRRQRMLQGMQSGEQRGSDCSLSSSEEEAAVHESLRCEICASRTKNFALPCGHLFCEHCLVMYLPEHPICPIDRSVIRSPPIRIYL